MGRRVTQYLTAPREKALAPRTSKAPIPGVRASASDGGKALPAGRGKAAVFITTSLAIRSGCRAAQAIPIMPPQSCTTKVTSRRSSESTSVPRSATRVDNV